MVQRFFIKPFFVLKVSQKRVDKTVGIVYNKEKHLMGVTL